MLMSENKQLSETCIVINKAQGSAATREMWWDFQCHVTKFTTESAGEFLHFAWVVDDAKCIVVTRVCVSVCLCLCPRPHAYTIARTRM